MSTKRRLLKISQARRVWLFDRQESKCCWCGKGMVLGALSKHAATEEHLVPQKKLRRMKRRGHDIQDNARFILLACFKCNTGRKNDDVPESLLELAARYFHEWGLVAPPLPLAEEK